MAESTVNPVVSKRFAKHQQMQWSKRGAHLLLQTAPARSTETFGPPLLVGIRDFLRVSSSQWQHETHTSLCSPNRAFPSKDRREKKGRF